MSRSWAGGSTRAHRKARARVLARDGGLCTLRLDVEQCPRHRRLCRVPCKRYARHAHHTRGKAVTGDDPAYMVATCEPCNLHVGDPTKWPDPKGRSVTQW